jgi:RecA-family ATPase
MANEDFNCAEPPPFIPMNDDSETKQTVRPQDKVQWLDLRAAVEQSRKEIDFVLPGLKQGAVGALVATGGVGKTMIAVQMCMTVASGYDMLNLESLGWQCKTGKVIFLSAEDDLDILHNRINAMGAVLSPTNREAMYENLRIASLVGLGANVHEASWQAWFYEATKGARLVVFDTLRRFHQLDENDNGAMANLIAWLEVICKVNGITVIFLHHTNKASSGADVTQHSSRGASVLTDNARWQANLAVMSEKEAEATETDSELRSWFVKLCFTKLNYSQPLPDVWLRKREGGALELAQFATSSITKKKEKGGKRDQTSY